MFSEFGTAGGVYLSEGAINTAKPRDPEIQFSAGYLYEIELAKESVDIVVCQEVILHVSDQLTLLDQIAEVTKSCGYLIITAANKFVMEHMRDSDGVGYGPEDPDKHIEKRLSMKELKRLLAPYFKVIRTTSVIPMGNRGWLRIINSQKLNKLLGWLISTLRVEAIKNRMMFGYSIIAVGQKKSELLSLEVHVLLQSRFQWLITCNLIASGHIKSSCK